MSEPARNQLGEFLRSRRDRLTPEAVGLSPGRRRRIQGLRREEVAELAGIGVDWYVRMEQGRVVSPSIATIEALARALRLDRAEHAHLRSLARAPHRAVFERETASSTLRQIVSALQQPAYVTGRRWDMLAWNEAAVRVFGDFGARPANERNILLFLLTTPEARQLFGTGWAREARRVTAQFRAVYGQWAGDPAFESLRVQLIAGCAEFERWWAAHDVAEPGSGRKRFHLSEGWAVDFLYATFQANDDPALKFSIYTEASHTAPASRGTR